MREILFRGKTDKGKWIEGDLYQSRLKSIFMISRYTEHGNRMTEVVNPETVGQYTGRNVGADKLFEGDIIEWVEDYDDNWGDSKTYIGRSLVIWDNDNSCWAVKTDNYIQFFNDFTWDRCYVIGNIHDHPELLKGE